MLILFREALVELRGPQACRELAVRRRKRGMIPLFAAPVPNSNAARETPLARQSAYTAPGRQG
jgi:hypothetical protein